MSIFKTIGRISKILKTLTTKPTVVTTEPTVVVDLACAGVTCLMDVTSPLTKPTGTNTLRIKCPRCEQTYNLRIKKDNVEGDVLTTGRLHEFTIISINRQRKRSFT